MSAFEPGDRVAAIVDISYSNGITIDQALGAGWIVKNADGHLRCGQTERAQP